MLAILISGPAHAAPAVDLAIGRVTVTVDLPRATPFVGEMLVVTMRSAIHANIALHDIRQPDFRNFDWQQFGVDQAVTIEMDGFSVAGIERKVAIFPQRAGHFSIAPFVRHVTLVVDNGERVEADFVSNALEIDVASHDGTGPPGSFWLPAKNVRISDSFDPAPDQIGLNETSRRTIVIEAEGMTADRLPPPPNLRALGVIVFAGPVERETIITENAPVARATYRYNIRPANDAPAKLPAIHMPWFDVTARVMRDAALAEQRVSFVNPLGEAKIKAAKAAAWRAWQGLAAGLAGFAWMAALGAWLAGAWRLPPRWWRQLAPLPAPFRRLRAAARAGDAQGFWRAAGEVAAREPGVWGAVAAQPAIAAGMAGLEAAVFGRAAGDVDLAGLAGMLAREWRKACTGLCKLPPSC